MFHVFWTILLDEWFLTYVLKLCARVLSFYSRKTTLSEYINTNSAYLILGSKTLFDTLQGRAFVLMVVLPS